MIGLVFINTVVQSNHVEERLPLLIVEGDFHSLLGQDWLQHIRLDWVEIKKIRTSQHLLVEALSSQFSSAFLENLGTYTGPPARISMAEDAEPKFCKTRTVPLALRDKVCSEMQSEGIIEAVEYSEWAAPLVPVIKMGQSESAVTTI